MPETRTKNRTKEISHQGEAFKTTARELGCDEDPARFDEALKKVARHKPFQQKSKRPKKSEKK
jgi:hypothetical protein